MTAGAGPARWALLLAAAVLAACTPNDAESNAIAVRSTADVCELSADEAPSGIVAFDITNEGSDVTEFYLLGADGVEIISEIENIGPGITRRLLVRADPGDYVTACKPGMVGDGIRARFTVTEAGD